MSANRTSDLTVLSIKRQLSSRIREDSSSTITYCIRTHEKATNSARVGWLRYISDSTITYEQSSLDSSQDGRTVFFVRRSFGTEFAA